MNETIQQLTELYYLCGIWQREAEATDRAFCKTVRKLMYLFYFILFFIFDIVSGFLSESKIELFFIVAIALVISVVGVKLFYLFWKKDEIFVFLNYPCVTHFTADDDKAESLNNQLKMFNKFIRFYLVMLCILFAFYAISCWPIFTNEKKLPLFITFTLVGNYSEIVYWIEYAFLLTEVIYGFMLTSINVIIWSILLNFSMEYRALGNQLRKLGVNEITIDGPNSSERTTTKSFHQNCFEIIKWHQNIHGYCSNQITQHAFIIGGLAPSMDTENDWRPSCHGFDELDFDFSRKDSRCVCL